MIPEHKQPYMLIPVFIGPVASRMPCLWRHADLSPKAEMLQVFTNKSSLICVLQGFKQSSNAVTLPAIWPGSLLTETSVPSSTRVAYVLRCSNLSICKSTDHSLTLRSRACKLLQVSWNQRHGKPLTIERTLHGLDSAYTTIALAHSQQSGPPNPANICLSMTRVDSIRAYA